MQPLRFVLQAIDPEFGHPAFECMFMVERPDELRAILGLEAGLDPDLTSRYRLEPREVSALTRHFALGFDPGGRQTALFKWMPREAMPYLAHTGYELVLMIDGRKPFARMQEDVYPPLRFEGEEQFDRFVAEGLLHKEEELEPFAEPTRRADGRTAEGLRTVYYARKGEEWRIPAWKLVSRAAAKTGWNDTLERLEGMLLGYEDWQNDWWADDRRRRGEQFGKLRLHLAVTAEELAAIETAGRRALPAGQRALRLLGSSSNELDGDDRRWLTAGLDTAALVRFSVPAHRFLTAVADDPQAARHDLPADRVAALNRLVEGEIEVLGL